VSSIPVDSENRSPKIPSWTSSAGTSRKCNEHR
jgi:hypothetical protein